MFDQSDDSPVWVVPVEAKDLGTPPPIPPTPEGQQEDHCDDWFNWFNKLGATPVTNLFFVSVSAPPDAQVSIVDSRVQVLKKYAAPATLVQCMEGAGGHNADPAWIDLDAGHPQLTLESPSGDIILESGRGQYQTDAHFHDFIGIIPRGTLGYMYEWKLSLTYYVNAEKMTVTSQVFRSYIRAPVDDSSRPMAYEYDQDGHAWVQTPAIAY